MSIGEQIKKRRKELGMSAEDLGKATGRSRATIYRLENGDTSSFTLDTLASIAQALNVSLDYLLHQELLQAYGLIDDELSEIEKKTHSMDERVTELEQRRDETFEKYGALMSALDTLSEDDLKEVENFIKFKTSQSDE